MQSKSKVACPLTLNYEHVAKFPLTLFRISDLVVGYAEV
jgi:hypothetical protein